MKLTKFQSFDVGLFVFVGVYIYVLATSEIRIDSAYIPTAVNGMASLTGIVIGLCSVLIVFSMNQNRDILKKYRNHTIGSMTLLIVSSFALVSAYNDLLQGLFVASVKSAEIGLTIAFSVVYEFLIFFTIRVVPELRKD